MSQKSVNGSYWQKPPGARNQILLISTSLEERIPHDHPVRLLDEILTGLDWTAWENTYDRKLGQPPIHPKVLCSVLLFAMIRRIRSSRSIEILLKELDGQIETAMAELETNDSIDELFDDGTSADKLPPELAELMTRRAKLKEVFE